VPAPRGPSRLVLLATTLAVAFVVVPYLFWRQTWFGRPLSGSQIGEALTDTQRPRRIQHALAQLSERMVRGDAEVREHYPKVAGLGSHALAEIRTTAAWLMGQDNGYEPFHQALRVLLGDPDLMVRRNAALSLVRFGDSAGRGELLAMLRPYEVKAPAAGRLELEARVKHEVLRGTALARIEAAGGRRVEVRSPVSGEVAAVAATGGSAVSAGDLLVTLAPDPDQAWEALRALYLVGEAADVRAVERYESAYGVPDKVRQQAAFTARAIRTRAAPDPTR